jgi:hypothetical protein
MTLPCNENGIILDTNVVPNVGDVLRAPVADVFVYSHGWWNDFANAMQSYNLFSVGFERELQVLPAAGLALPGESVAAAIHWPSMLSEDPTSIANYAEALTFYTMGKRADTVGHHGVSSLLRLLYASPRRPLRISMIGHSFGCRVVCSALVSALAQLTPQIDSNIRIRVALLEAAFNSDDLGPNGSYASLARVAGASLSVLCTTSALDTALVKWYPIAERLANLFRGGSVDALGGVGPDSTTVSAWGGRGDVNVGPGFDTTGILSRTERLVVANLTPLHESHPAGNAGAFGGHHSDIFLPEIYRLLAGFLFRP